MRRFAIALTCFMLMFTLMPFAGALAESGDDVVVVYQTDEFIAEHADDAISCADSQAFDVIFYVAECPDQDGLSPDQMRVRFVLNINSKLDTAAYGVNIDVHYSDDLRPILASPAWYNNDFDVFPQDSGKVPTGIEYTYDAIVDLKCAYLLGGLVVDQFYGMYIEVTWREGLSDKHSEIWDMSQTGYQAAVDWYNALPEDAPEREQKLIDEDSLAAINDKAKALSN